MEHFLIIANGWKPLTHITKSSILNVAAVLDSPLLLLTIKLTYFATTHNVKSFHIRSFFWSVFSYIRTEYEDLIQYGVNLRIQNEWMKIRTRKNYVYGHFSRSEHSKFYFYASIIFTFYVYLFTCDEQMFHHYDNI